MMVDHNSAYWNRVVRWLSLLLNFSTPPGAKRVAKHTGQSRL
jgi:hypothetical protein